MKNITLKTNPKQRSNSPDIKFAIVGNVWIKLMTFNNVGDYIPGHTHSFDHPTLLCQGSVEVNVDGHITKFAAPAIIYIERKTIHKLTALEPNTVASCIHGIGEELSGASEIISQDMLPKGTNIFNSWNKADN